MWVVARALTNAHVPLDLAALGSGLKPIGCLEAQSEADGKTRETLVGVLNLPTSQKLDASESHDGSLNHLASMIVAGGEPEGQSLGHSGALTRNGKHTKRVQGEICCTRPERVLRLYFRILITTYDCASLVRYAIWDPCESIKIGYSSNIHTDDLRLPRAHGHVQSISGSTTAWMCAPAPPHCIPPLGRRTVQ